MQLNTLKKKLRAGKTVLGPFLKLSDPAIVEIAGLAGFDFVIIDTEHGPNSMQTAQNLVRSAEIHRITPIIRITENNPSLIVRALDIGAGGIQVPQVSNKTEALRIVGAAKFSPKGNRGVCRFVRAADYSCLDQFKYFKKSNQETLIIVHIEGIEGINNLAEILTVKGLDIIFLGPYDLSQSCRVPGQVNHIKVTKKMQEAVELAKEANITVGTFVDTIEDAKKWIKVGITYISFSVDVGIFSNACSDIVRNLMPFMRH